MANLKNLKNIKFQLDERGKLRAQIGMSIGMTIGIGAAFVAIVILAQMQLWYKICVGIGLGCAFLMQLGGVTGSIGRLKAYNAAMAEYEKLNTSQETTTYHG